MQSLYDPTEGIPEGHEIEIRGGEVTYKGKAYPRDQFPSFYGMYLENDKEFVSCRSHNSFIKIIDTIEENERLKRENNQLQENTSLFLKALTGDVDLNEIDKDEELQELIKKNARAFKEKRNE